MRLCDTQTTLFPLFPPLGRIWQTQEGSQIISTFGPPLNLLSKSTRLSHGEVLRRQSNLALWSLRWSLGRLHPWKPWSVLVWLHHKSHVYDMFCDHGMACLKEKWKLLEHVWIINNYRDIFIFVQVDRSESWNHNGHKMVHSEHPNKCHNYKRSMWQTSISLCVSCNFSARDLFNYFQVLNTVHTKSRNKTGWTWYIHVYSNRFPGTFFESQNWQRPKAKEIISTKALISFFRMYFAMKKTTSILAQKKNTESLQQTCQNKVW